jgi:hypothetical protein
MSRVRSQHVVGYVESGLSRDNDVYWLVMELLEAESLDHILDHGGPMPELSVIRVSLQQCEEAGCLFRSLP